MLRFFRVNDPYRLVVIFVIMVGIRFLQGFFLGEVSYFGFKWMLLGEWLDRGFEMYRETYDYTGPLAAFVYKYLDFLFGRSFFVHAAFSSLLIIYQASVFNKILLRNKAYDENSYLPAFLYMVAMVSVPDLMALSPQLMSLTFILLALRFVLRRIDNQVTDELFLNSGIFTGVATMIYLPAAVFFLVFLVALILFSTAITRRLLLYLFSFFLIVMMCGLYFYWRGDLALFAEVYFIKNLWLEANARLSTLEIIYLVGGLAFIFLIAVFKTWSRARMTNFQAKIQQVIWLFVFGGTATFFLSNEKALHELVFFIPAVAYFWTHYFILLKKRFWQLLMPPFLILGLLSYSAFSLNHWTDGLQLGRADTDYQQVLVFDVDWSYYIDQPVGSPFFSEPMLDDAFEGLDYYVEATDFFSVVSRLQPEHLLGPEKRIQMVFFRFPTLASQYRQVRPGLYKRISN